MPLNQDNIDFGGGGQATKPSVPNKPSTGKPKPEGSIEGAYNKNPVPKTRNSIYYSGANVKVYFGDVWVEELASIQYSIDEQVAPVYGFNSYMFDKVARGTRLVSGAFIVNHTEAGYIDTILERIASNIDKEQRNALSKKSLGHLVSDVRKHDSSRNIENLLKIDGSSNYEDYIEGLKSSFWGPRKPSQNTIHRSGEGREYQPNYYADKEGGDSKNILKQHGFNILLDFSPSANVKDFKQCITDMNNEGSMSQTFRSIIGVHLTGENQLIAPNGQAIQTQYNFIARDIDGDVSQLSMKYNQLDRYNTKNYIPDRADENIYQGMELPSKDKVNKKE